MKNDYPKLSLFIDGQWLSDGGRREQPAINPVDRSVLGHLPHATREDLDLALDAAERGFKLWRSVSPYERAKVLRKAADFIRADLEDTARLMTMEEGKSLAESRAELATTADIFDWCADEGRRTYGRLVPARSAGHRQMVVREPIGPVAGFSPWNFPAVTPGRKISGALAAGCSIILKPAEETPAAPLAMARALERAGLPAGVLNVVYGVPSEISEYLIASPVIRKISFTGSTVVGKLLAGLAAKGVKPATLELGGHAPVVVFDDVDAEKVAEMAAATKFRNAGQVCTSPTRFYVHEGIYNRFAGRFADLARNWPVGNGLDDGVLMGPHANSRRVDALESFVQDARDCGARIAAGGERFGNEGFFWQPTVLAEVPHEARIMNQEPFGAVAVLQPFSSFDEVVAAANRLPYGLAAYAFTRDVSRATAIGDALEAGMVGVNTFGITVPETPFGGVKESGYGSEGGMEGFEPYLTTKYISQL